MWTYSYTDSITLDSLKRVERPDPDPGPHDIVIRMRAAALNHRDLALVSGHYHISAQPPLIPLSDGSGEVVQIGSEVKRFRVGDIAAPVYLPDWIDGPVTPRAGRRRLGGPTDGVLAELKCVNEEEAVLMPRHLSPCEAATLPITGVTAWQALNQTSSLKAGESVLIQGTGGLSLTVIQIAKMAGTRAIVLTRDDRHTRKLKELGADVIIPRGETDGWAKDVIAATDGRGADVSMDILGGESLNRTIAATRAGGMVHLAGFVTSTSATIDIFQAIRHAIIIHVTTAGHRASFEALNRALDFHGVRPVVGSTFALDRVRDAFEKMRQGGKFGKIVIDIAP